MITNTKKIVISRDGLAFFEKVSEGLSALQTLKIQWRLNIMYYIKCMQNPCALSRGADPDHREPELIRHVLATASRGRTRGTGRGETHNARRSAWACA